MSKVKLKGKGVCGPAFLMCKAFPDSFFKAATSACPPPFFSDFPPDALLYVHHQRSRSVVLTCSVSAAGPWLIH